MTKKTKKKTAKKPTRPTLFQKSTNTQAYLKAGIMGFAGSGKTYTATTLGIGLINLMRERKLPHGDAPAMFIDTETGSDWVAPRFDAAGIELFVAKTRAFTDLLTAVDEAESMGSVLVIDSITHFWRELQDTYLARKNKTFIEFQDWAWLKQQWGVFTDRFVNSNCHIVLCGRAGYEYDFFERDDGKRELQKTGVKMKAEGETGYEPSLLVMMEIQQSMETGKVWRTGAVLKDRSTLLDGKTFNNPTFEDFLPHVEFLNLGAEQFGVDTDRKSESLFAEDGTPKWQHEKLQRDIWAEEIEQLLRKHFPSQSAGDKQSRMDLLEKYAGTRSWTRVTRMRSESLRSIFDQIKYELESDQAEGLPPVDTEGDVDI